MFGILCFITSSNNAIEMQKKMCAVYGECTVTDQTWQKWFAKFHAGDFSLDGAPQLGRPVEVDSDQIETLTENNQCYTMQETADILKTAKSIKLLVKMKGVSFILWKKLNGLFGQPKCTLMTNVMIASTGIHLAFVHNTHCFITCATFIIYCTLLNFSCVHTTRF